MFDTHKTNRQNQKDRQIEIVFKRSNPSRQYRASNLKSAVYNLAEICHPKRVLWRQLVTCLAVWRIHILLCFIKIIAASVYFFFYLHVNISTGMVNVSLLTACCAYVFWSSFELGSRSFRVFCRLISFNRDAD